VILAHLARFAGTVIACAIVWPSAVGAQPEAAPPAAGATPAAPAPAPAPTPSPTPAPGPRVVADAAAGGVTLASDPRTTFAPLLTLSGDTKGEGKLSLGLDRLMPLGDKRSDLRLTLSAEIASSDGLATLVTGDEDGLQGPTSWLLGLDATYSVLQSIPGFTGPGLDAATPAQKRSIVLSCLAEDPDPIATVRRWRRKQLARDPDRPFSVEDETIDEIDPLDLCPKGIARLAEAENERKLPLPRIQLSFGFRLGSSELTQLSPGADPMVLSKTTRRRLRIQAGMTYALFSPSTRLALDLPLSIDSTYVPSSDKARWCTPVGSIDRGDGSGADPAELCSELPLGDPVRKTSLRAAAHLGYVGDDTTWRASMGPTVGYVVGPGTNPYEVGLEAPIYLARATSQFSGVVRVTPAVLLTRDEDGKEDTKVLLTIALLADRTLFPTALR
jgi:hypothetical protein